MRKLLLILFTLSIPLFSTGQDSYGVDQKAIHRLISSKKIRIGYGPVLAGSGDLLGQKFLLGGQFFLSKHHAFDVRLSGTLINVEKDFNNNPDWHFYQASNGIEGVLEYNFVLSFKKVRFYTSLGPAIRYSYERHAYSYGISLNHDTQDYDWFCDITEDTGFRLGYEFGLNADITIFNHFTIGPRASFSHYPAGGYTFAFIGLTLINQQF